MARLIISTEQGWVVFLGAVEKVTNEIKTKGLGAYNGQERQVLLNFAAAIAEQLEQETANGRERVP